MSAQRLARMKSFSGSSIKLVGPGAGSQVAEAGKAVPLSSSAAQTWSKGVGDTDVWDGSEWRPMDRRMAASGVWVESIKEWDVEHDHVPKAWQDGVHFTFRRDNFFEENEICVVANKKGNDLRFARVISSRIEGKQSVSDVALDATNETYVRDVPNHKIAKLRRALREGVVYYVNAQEDLLTWQKPPDVRDFIYTEAKEEFDKQHWSAAYEKFEDVVHEGKGEDWRHTKKYMAVCLEHLHHRRQRKAAAEAYKDAKHLFEVGHYAHAMTAFEFVLEISELGKKDENFHHAREYLAKCRHMVAKQRAEEADLQDEEGTILQSDKQKLRHYYTTFAPLGAAAREVKQAVSLDVASQPWQVMTVPTDASGAPLSEREIVRSLSTAPRGKSLPRLQNSWASSSTRAASARAASMSRSIVGSKYRAPAELVTSREEEEDVKSDCSIS